MTLESCALSCRLEMNFVLNLVPPIIDLGTGLLLLFIILFVPHVVKGLALTAATSKYRNSNPRGFTGDTCAQLKEDIRKTDDKTKKAALVAQLGTIERSSAAHLNGIEFFAFFGVAAAVARIAGVSAPLVASATTVAVAARALYTFVYIIGSNEFLGSIRSICWAVGIAALFSLLWEASAADGGLVSMLG